MKILDHQDPAGLSRRAAFPPAIPRPILAAAEKIFTEVAAQGDPALFRFTRKLEKHSLSPHTVRVSAKELAAARRAVSPAEGEVILLAARRVRAFHLKQISRGFRFSDGQGTVIEERVVPLDRVGLCIPGGRFPLASTVLMTAIPARLAGVQRVVMISPWPEGRMNPHVIFAAGVAGVDEIYKIGGVQGVAALAGGTASIPAVDKIVGPGSVWVTAAKALAVSRGLCGIDGLAGPSEVVVVADETARAEWVALDLLSQAEHGHDSAALLITTSRALAKKVELEIKKYHPKTGADSIMALIVKNLDQAAQVVNGMAPEHLEIMVRSPRSFVKKIRNAASIFVGPYSPVPAGDYMAGGNHVLPTGRTARFSSPLGVYDFVKRQSVTELSPKALARIAGPVARFAELEGLQAHGEAVRSRQKNLTQRRKERKDKKDY